MSKKMRTGEEKIGEALSSLLESAQDYDTFDVNIFLAGEPAAAALSSFSDAAGTEDAEAVIDSIQTQSAAMQSDLLSYLQGASTDAAFMDGEVAVPQAANIDSFWINNSVAAEVSYQTLESILARTDVVHVELERRVNIEELMDAGRSYSKKSGSKKKPKKGKKGDETAVKKITATKIPGVSAAKKISVTIPPLFFSNLTWSVKRIKAHLLWQLGINGDGIVVAVVDTGVNYKHPDLKNRMWNGGAAFPKHGFDFDSNDKDPWDEAGHGTSCAGIVAGDGASGQRTGVAPKARIMAIRVGGAERNFWKGLEFAIQQKANVISMSMSWKYPSRPDYPGWRRVCETILAAGLLHANSIGNQGDQLGTYPIPYNIATPGNCPPPRIHPLQVPVGKKSSPISCGATDDSDKLASYSGRGPAAWENPPYTDYPYLSGNKPGLIKPDVCAPGPGTTSCNWRFGQDPGAKPYSSFGGTSSATPHVGGCLALLAQACKKAGKPIVPARVQEALENTAVRVVGQTKDKQDHYGAGRVDVYAAYKYGHAKGWW
jgi:subtilisin family serine protease